MAQKEQKNKMIEKSKEDWRIYTKSDNYGSKLPANPSKIEKMN